MVTFTFKEKVGCAFNLKNEIIITNNFTTNRRRT
jgi:hypothetical protein